VYFFEAGVAPGEALDSSKFKPKLSLYD